jgi:DNA-binding NarL/FixJ family response regulator
MPLLGTPSLPHNDPKPDRAGLCIDRTRRHDHSDLQYFMMTEPIRILIADDHARVRTQLRTRLSREPGFVVSCEADSSMATIDCALELAPDIVLIDPIMQDGYGLQAIQRLRTQLPETAIVVLTAFTDTAMQMALRAMGVVRILSKDLDLTELITILKSAGVKDGSSPGIRPAE